jgi:hypothetical protein
MPFNKKEAPKEFDRDQLRYARSHMELEAYRQRWIQIVLTATNVLVAGLTCLKVFGIL